MMQYAVLKARIEPIYIPDSNPLGPIIIYSNRSLVKNPLKEKLENFIIYKNNLTIGAKNDRVYKEYSDQMVLF